MEVVLKKMGIAPACHAATCLEGFGDAGRQHLTLNTTDIGQIVLTPKRKFVLADMIAKCDMKAAPPADMAIWDSAPPVGQEVL